MWHLLLKSSVIYVSAPDTLAVQGGNQKNPNTILVLCVSTSCAYTCNVWKSLSSLKFALLHAYSNVPLCLVECHCKAWEWREILTVFVFLFTCVYTFLGVYICVWGLEDLRCPSGIVHPLFVFCLPSVGVINMWCCAWLFFFRWVRGTEMESSWSPWKLFP